MKILLTNDDGIHSPGLSILKELFTGQGHSVTVVAPLEEKSGVSQSITFRTPLRVQKIRKNGKFFGYGVSGNPADCVKVAVKALLENSPQFVISGINNGYNFGWNIFYSGTVAGATEGVIQGIPSMAFSAEYREDGNFEDEGTVALKVFEFLKNLKISKMALWNINIPPQQKGVLATRQSLEGLDEKYTIGKSPSGEPFYWLSGKFDQSPSELDLDQAAVLKGYVSITPVLVDRTSYSDLERLREHLKLKKGIENPVCSKKERNL